MERLQIIQLNKSNFEEYKVKDMSNNDRLNLYSNVIDTAQAIWDDEKTYTMFLDFYDRIKKQSLIKVSSCLEKFDIDTIVNVKNQIYKTCDFPLPSAEVTRKIFIYLAQEIEYSEVVTDKQEKILEYKNEDMNIKKTIRRVERIQKKLEELNFYLSHYKNNNDIKTTERLEKEIKTLTNELETISPQCNVYSRSLTEEEYETFVKQNAGPIERITKSEIEKLLQENKLHKVDTSAENNPLKLDLNKHEIEEVKKQLMSKKTCDSSQNQGGQ